MINKKNPKELLKEQKEAPAPLYLTVSEQNLFDQMQINVHEKVSTVITAVVFHWTKKKTKNEQWCQG